MKKHLFFTFLCIALVQFTFAQVIEVVGKGILNDNNPTLTITDLSSVDKVVVEAAAIFDYGETIPTVFPGSITFSSAASFTVPFKNVEDLKAPDNTLITNGSNTYYKLWDRYYYSNGYYTATFSRSQINSNGIISLNKNGLGINIMTFYAYVYRTNGTVNKFSIISNPLNRAFVYRNGEMDPLERYFTLPAASVPRNIKVAVPFSDRIDIDDRIGVITLFSGSQQTDEQVFQLNNGGDNFHVEEIMLTNVPANVTDVKVTIFSPPNTDYDGKLGDSFIVGLPVLTVEKQDQGCTHSYGYWKTHSKYGPAKPADPAWNKIGPDKWGKIGPDARFFKSGKSYITVLQTSPKGDKYYILAHQYIAAELNFLAGANSSAVIVEFNQAKDLLERYGPDFCDKLRKNECSELEKIFTKLAEKLDKYNNGKIGPGNCDEECDKDEDKDHDCDKDHHKDYCKYDKDKNHDCDRDHHNDNCKEDDKNWDNDHKDNWWGKKIKVQVSPNPIKSNANISFTPAWDGYAVVELFDWMGNKKARLYNQKVNKDSTVKFSFSGNQYRDGLYILKFTNGTVQETITIKINK